jgi:DNA-binding FrmR family transcriptional regulator
MVTEDAYCIDILTQISAVRTALEQVAVQVLRAHAEGCVATALRSGEGAEEKLDELMDAVNRFARLR